MALVVYNTLSKSKEAFEPLTPEDVKIYVCGPTVYDSCHIGHARSVVVFDVIVRYLKALGYRVTYVRNFTDVDDKIISRARELELTEKELSEKYIQEFYQDMDALNVNRATLEPKATEHIQQMIEVIERLIDKGVAYEIDGDVYFSVAQFEGYGALSGRKLEDMEAGARVDVDERKKSPFDFALWKSAKPKEPFWESPWGKGRPGWHIECSAMSSKYLGQTFDIHGGGKDLIFPHHENEIAQSEAAFDKPFAKYWLHNGFVNINSEKMSKSLGNFLMIKDVLKLYHPEVVRLFLLTKHYRSPIDFNDHALNEISTSLDKIYTSLERAVNEIPLKMIQKSGKGDDFEKFKLAMDEDFNTAKAIGILFDVVRDLNRMLDHKAETLSPTEKESLNIRVRDILAMGDLLGVLQMHPQKYFEEKKALGQSAKDVDAGAIDLLVTQRTQARTDRDWAKADEIREKLTQLGVVVEDKADGTIWKFANK